VLIEERPSMLRKVCQALADQEVNILALECFPTRGKFVTRLIVDKPDKVQTVLDNEKLSYVEKEIVQSKIQHRPGEIARLASRLGKAHVNINCAYCALEPGTHAPLVFFGAGDVGKGPQPLTGRVRRKFGTVPSDSFDYLIAPNREVRVEARCAILKDAVLR